MSIYRLPCVSTDRRPRAISAPGPLALRVLSTIPLAAAAAFLLLGPGSAQARARAHHHAPRAAENRSSGVVTSRESTRMSRASGYAAPADQPITGQVATIVSDNAPIYAGREQNGQLLFRTEKGSTVLVTGQTDDYYAVAMSNHTLGYIAKSDAQLQDIQVTTAGAADAAAPADDAAQNSNPLVQGLLQSATNYLGIAPYVWGGNTIRGIDCSGFVKAVYAENGIRLPRTAAQQAQVGLAVPQNDVSQWVPGDRMYFECHHDYIDHTGMYIGNGFFIHSSIHHHGVDIDRVDSAFYSSHLVAVRRSPEVINGTVRASPAVNAPDFESDQE